jgi:hypothetical protein
MDAGSSSAAGCRAGMNQHGQDGDISINGVIDFLEDPVVGVVNSAAAIGVGSRTSAAR